MLNDTYAENELKRLLQEYYSGKINKLSFINYQPETILRTFGSNKLNSDELKVFDNMIDYKKNDDDFN